MNIIILNLAVTLSPGIIASVSSPNISSIICAGIMIVVGNQWRVYVEYWSLSLCFLKTLRGNNIGRLK